MANEWVTQVQNMTVSGDGYAIITLFSLQAGSLYSLHGIDTANSIKIEVAADVQLNFNAKPSRASDVISIELDNSVTVETPQRKKYVDGLTGSEKVASSSDAVPTIVVTNLDGSVATLRKLNKMAEEGEPVIITIGLGKNTIGANVGKVRLIGTMGAFSRQTSGNSYVPTQLTISGGIAYDDTGGVTAALADYNAAVANPTPVGDEVIVIEDIASAGNYTTLLNGKLYIDNE